MRPLVLVAAAVLAAACGEAVGHPDAVRVAAGPATMLLSDGGVMRPLEQGGRVALRSGWATVSALPGPRDGEIEMTVALFDAAGAPADAGVSAVYESLEMDHGRTVVQGVVREGAARLALRITMPGAWGVELRIRRADADETFRLMLPDVGR